MPGFEWPVYKSSGMVKSGKVRSEFFVFVFEGKEIMREERKEERGPRKGSFGTIVVGYSCWIIPERWREGERMVNHFYRFSIES